MQTRYHYLKCKTTRERVVSDDDGALSLLGEASGDENGEAGWLRKWTLLLVGIRVNKESTPRL